MWQYLQIRTLWKCFSRKSGKCQTVDENKRLRVGKMGGSIEPNNARVFTDPDEVPFYRNAVFLK